MTVILDLVKSDISVSDICTWLTSTSNHQDIENIIFKNDEVKCSRQSFPVLLVAFIRDQSSSTMKWHNIGPAEENCPSSPNWKGNLTVQNVFSPTATIKPKSPVVHHETRNINIRKITPQKLDLQNETTFPPLTPGKEVPKKRRINPTQLTEGGSGVPRALLQFGPSPTRPLLPSPNQGNPFNQAKEQIDHKNLDQERALLKERKQMVTTHVISPDRGSAVPKTWNCIEPKPSSVTHVRELERLSALLAFCLTQHLVPFLYNEIKFLIEMLVVRVSPRRLQPSSNDKDVNLLGNSVHNCVFFAASTLEKLDGLLLYIDRCLIQLLASNARLIAFSSVLIQRLSELAISSTEEKKRLPRQTVANVAFQSDTDNRLNFASDTSFSTFRKQRDQFCEVWQRWKENNGSPGWNMAFALQKMIQSLVDMRRDCVNYAHLARLFRSQLLNVAQLMEQEEEVRSGLLGQLQSSDPDKLRRLRERLINPPESRARNSGRDPFTFEGDQEFFRDFILLAESPAFNEHLKNSLTSGIEEFSIEDCDEPVQFSETVVALQVMAKFLAFLNFHPHANSDRLPENVFHHLSRLRIGQSWAPIDLLHHLGKAYHSGRLVLTVPWLVVYLSQADQVSFNLPGCQIVLAFSVFLYRRAELSEINGFFVRLLFSCLFDLPYFPRSLFVQTDDELRSTVSSLIVQSQVSEGQIRLDQRLDLVDTTLMYQCCPYLWTWKHLLTDFASSDSHRGQGEHRLSFGRKITPVSAGGIGEPSPSKLNSGNKIGSVKSLQLTLRENFFHNQPSSVKRTVDFVAERLASNIVRDIRHLIIPSLSSEAQAALKTWPLGEKNNHELRIEEVSQQLCNRVRQDATSKVASEMALLEGTLTTLLPNDLLLPVRKVCITIAAQEIRVKVTEWIDLHVTVGFFRDDLLVEWTKLEKDSALTTTYPSQPITVGLPAVHDSTTWPPSRLIDHLKLSIRHIIRDSSKLANQDVTDLLQLTQRTLQNRKDVTSVVFKCIQHLTFDFLFILCVFQPECVVSDSIGAWVDFWKRTYSSVVSPALTPSEESSNDAAAAPCSVGSSSHWLIFAPKQLLLLAQSMSPRQSWCHITVLILQLLRSDLVSFKQVQEQAVAVLRQEWPQELLGRFATCVRDIVENQKGKKHSSHQETSEDDNEVDDDELMSWLSWFCSQNDLL